MSVGGGVEDKTMNLNDVFFYSKRPNASKITTPLEEANRWESFFDPQHTFGPFTKEIPKPKTVEYYFKGRWPLDYEDIMGVAPKHLRKSQGKHMTSDGASMMSSMDDDAFLFPAVPNPALPNLKHLRMMAHMENEEEDEEEKGDVVQVEIAPCPSITLTSKIESDEPLLKERQRIFDIIQSTGFKESLDGTCFVRTKGGNKPPKMQRPLKADRSELTLDMLYEDTQEHRYLPSIAPSMMSYRDYHERVMEKQVPVSPSQKPLLYFILGFLFPPVWILGFTFVPKFYLGQTEASRASEKRLKRYSRNAFIIFVCLSVVIAIILIILKPQSIGFRKVEPKETKGGIVVF
ncbi:hypothetical protein BY458DRAFT_447528 [Sporodiniella umbellata]|nr:hypothetical protein BY458DRAFT_447528 [Sporodiniella umbellata]